jgi:transcriptional regulator NrdR family protein
MARKAVKKAAKKAAKKYCVVKRAGHHEDFDERKLYASCYAACVAAQIDKHIAERICDNVVNAVKRHLRKVKEIDSGALFKLTTKEMAKQDENAAFMYETHRDIA